VITPQTTSGLPQDDLWTDYTESAELFDAVEDRAEREAEGSCGDAAMDIKLAVNDSGTCSLHIGVSETHPSFTSAYIRVAEIHRLIGEKSSTCSGVLDDDSYP